MSGRIEASGIGWCLWCTPAAACPIHAKHPEFRPEELEDKDGHFEAKPEWVDKDCRACDGTGEADHECDCEHCTKHTDECEDCDGDGELPTCSLCGFQTAADHRATLDKHETTCWPKPEEATA